MRSVTMGPAIGNSASVWLVGTLAFANALWSFFNDSANSNPNFFYTAGKITLFTLLILSILNLGKPKHGTSIAALKPDALLTLRAYAAMLVLTGHYFYIGITTFNFKFHAFYRLLIGSPWAGVWIFFVLSGYLMGKGFYGNRYDLSPAGLSNYFRNRALRIVPVYAVVILVCAALFTPHLYRANSWWALAQYLTFDFKALPADLMPHGAAWSISTEVQFYFMAPFLSCWISRLSKYGAVILIVAGPAIPIAIVNQFGLDWTTFVFTPVLSNIGLFCAGIAVNNLVRGAQIGMGKNASIAAGLCILALFYVVIALWGSYTIFSGTLDNYFSLALVLTAWVASGVIFLFEAVPSALSGKLARAIQHAEIFGALTYCCYLLHEPILLHLFRRNGLPHFFRWNGLLNLTIITLYPIYLMIVLASSYCLYRFVEKRFDRLRFGHSRAKEENFGVFLH